MSRMPFNQSIQTRAVSSVYGKIEQILLAYPGGMADVQLGLVMDRYGEIFKAFSDRVTFVVAGHFGTKSDLAAQAKQLFEDSMRQNRIDPAQQLRFCHTPFAGSLSRRTHDVHGEWAQDPFIMMETDHHQTVLLEPIVQGNPENANLAEQLAAQAGYLMQPCMAEIEGGNILIGDDYALVGKDILLQNAKLSELMQPDKPQEWLETYLRSVLGVRFIIWVGLEAATDFGRFHSTGKHHFQPFFHLDLFVTPLGRTSTAKEGLLLARIDVEEVMDRTREDEDQLKRINELLDHVENTLERSGRDTFGPTFEIYRNEIGGCIVAGNTGRQFVPFAHNNAQIELFHTHKRIYLPSFPEMSRLESKLQGYLLRLGFDSPRLIKNNFQEYARNGGSLHCLSSVISRSL